MKHPLIAPARGAFLLIAAIVPTLAAGCGSDEKPSGATVVQELRGDTVVMVSSGEPERVQIDAVEVLWQSNEFEGRMTKMALLGDHLVIGDIRRVHVVSIQDGKSHTFGRAGQGPGEIGGTIRSVGGFGGDTIAVFDSFQVLLFSLDGEFLTSYRTTPQLPFSRPVTGYGAGDQPWYPLVRSGGGVLWERADWERRADGTQTARTALLWHDLGADTAAVLETWDYRDGTGGVFPDLVKQAIASDGRVATGYPATYCIRLLHAFEDSIRMGCRERSPVPIEAGFKDLSGLGPGANPDRLAQWLEENPVDVLPHFHRLFFSESGDLWVHLFHEEFAHVFNGLYVDGFQNWQPNFHEWEVFDRDAVLVRHVTLPGAFDLRVIGDGAAFGFLTLDTGEIVVGRVDLNVSAVPTT